MYKRQVDTSKPGVYLVEGTADGLAVQITVTVQTNKAELMKAVEAAKNYKENDYTADSWKQFTAALQEAQAVLDKAEEMCIRDRLQSFQCPKRSFLFIYSSARLTPPVNAVCPSITNTFL